MIKILRICAVAIALAAVVQTVSFDRHTETERSKDKQSEPAGPRTATEPGI